MLPNKIYKLGKNLGISKKDIDTVTNIQIKDTSIIISSPIDVYKFEGRYGTISINDFY